MPKKDEVHQCPEHESDGEDIIVREYDGIWFIWDMVELSGPSFSITYCPFCGKKLEK
jgi:hypothetical protein